ncbi:hypothetical protein lerEdw1_018605 [Lerista edwardsae]|nr:hypothetical protein lerEdw1_018605 [Lerista edwardsae]
MVIFLFPSPEMLHLIVFLLLATVLKQSLGKNGIVSDVPERLQEEIINKHNKFRRAVKPTARNMLKVKWDEKASKVAQAYAKKCPGRVSHIAQRTVDSNVLLNKKEINFHDPAKVCNAMR